MLTAKENQKSQNLLCITSGWKSEGSFLPLEHQGYGTVLRVVPGKKNKPLIGFKTHKTNQVKTNYKSMLLTIAWFQIPAPLTALGSFGSMLARIRSIRSATVASELVSKLPGLVYISLYLIACLRNHRIKQMWKP